MSKVGTNVAIQDINKEMAEYYGVPGGKGALLQETR